MKCLNCGQDVNEQASFCQACGFCLTNQRDGIVGICAGSGKPIYTNDEYFRCSQCSRLYLIDYRSHGLPICSICICETGCALHKENESPDDHKPEQSRTETITDNESPRCPQSGKIWAEPVTGMEFVWVPGGKFMMGSPETEEGHCDDEGPQHEVELDGFWLGKYPVTQAQWQHVMGSNPSEFKGKRRPVEKVSWKDAQRFVAKFGSLNSHAYTFCLPTEAQWEYACRAGSTTRYSVGNSITMRQANFEKEYDSETTDVDLFAPNAWGLHDMHGNVREWCEDVYNSTAYNREGCKNPLVSYGSSYRVLRGGCWYNLQTYLRSAYRSWSDPGRRLNHFGFRLLGTN